MSRKIKKMKKILASAFALCTYVSVPSSYANFNPISNTYDWFSKFSRSIFKQRKNYIEVLCDKNDKLSSTLTKFIKQKNSNDEMFVAKIELIPLNQGHEKYWKKIIDCSNPKIKEYLKYFTKSSELTDDKGQRYFDKHMSNMSFDLANDDIFCEAEKDIFFTIKYSEFESPVSKNDIGNQKVKFDDYVGTIGLTRAYGGNPDLEIIVDPQFKGRGIASSALSSLIDFASEYNFTTNQLENQIPCIEAMIADKNIGSQKMALKNNFECVGRANEDESNGHDSHRYIKIINRNPVLNFAKNYNQHLISSWNGEYPPERVITGDNFFCNDSKDYESLKKEIDLDLRNLDVPDGLEKDKYIEMVKSNLSDWPIAWVNNDGSLQKALNISFLQSTLDELKSKEIENLGLNFLTNPLNIENFEEKITF